MKEAGSDPQSHFTQLVHTDVPLSRTSIIFYRAKGSDAVSLVRPDG